MQRSTRSTVPLEAAVAALIALTSIDGARLTEPWPLTVATGAATLLVVVFATTSVWGGARLEPRSWPFVLLIAWTVWAAAGSAVGGLATAALAGQMATLVLAAAIIARSGGPRSVARTLISAAVLALGAHLVVMGLTDLEWRNDGRLQLAALEPNELARVALVAAIAGLWTSSRQRRRLDIVAVAVAVVAIGAMAATGSRTAAGAFVLSCVLLSFSAPNRRLSAAGVGAALLLGGLLTSVGSIDLPGVTTAIERGEEGTQTLSGRERMWPQILDASTDKPILGIGVGQDRTFMQNEINVGWEPQHTHNLALHLSLTTGFVGLAILLTSILGAVARAVQQRAILPATLLLALLVDGFSEPVMRVASFGWFALCAAIILVDRDRAVSSEAEATSHLSRDASADEAARVA